MCLYLRHVLVQVVGLELTNPIEDTRSALALDQCVLLTFTQKRLFTIRCFFKLLWVSDILKCWVKYKVMVQVLALSFVLHCLASCLPGICDRKGTSKNYFLEFADDEDIPHWAHKCYTFPVVLNYLSQLLHLSFSVQCRKQGHIFMHVQN